MQIALHISHIKVINSYKVKQILTRTLNKMFSGKYSSWNSCNQIAISIEGCWINEASAGTKPARLAGFLNEHLETCLAMPTAYSFFDCNHSLSTLFSFRGIVTCDLWNRNLQELTKTLAALSLITTKARALGRQLRTDHSPLTRPTLRKVKKFW